MSEWLYLLVVVFFAAAAAAAASAIVRDGNGQRSSECSRTGCSTPFFRADLAAFTVNSRPMGQTDAT